MINWLDHSVKFLPEFQKDLQKFSVLEIERVKQKLKNILEETSPANVKKLKNYPLGRFRLRIGKFRLIFNIFTEKNLIVFTTCKRRRDLY
jgi:mRNA-degrading endonuclease RelE of RelBE toxin-antitoxin system